MNTGHRIVRDADLARRNTFGVPVRAGLLVEVDDARALPELFAGPLRDGPVLVLGGGSNLLFAGPPDVPVLALAGRGIAVDADDGDRVRVRAEAGADWDGLVRWTLARGLGGLENLALIPGTVGAAPIQNIGAYGAEARDTIAWVEAYEPATGRGHRLASADCAFAYRDSLFKREPGRFVVTAVAFDLVRASRPRVDYAGVRDALDAMGVGDAPTPLQVADAVTAIRRRKLPDPARIGNAGSFFKNPIVPSAQADALRDMHPDLPAWPVGDAGTKLSAAWLIDQCGWKGHRDGDAGVAPTHALVLVNHGAATGRQLLDLARRIAGSVHERFGVALEPEPRIIGATW